MKDNVTARLTAVKQNRPVLLIAAFAGLILLTMAGLFTIPAIAAFGAFTTLIVGIAAQQSLGNVFAGILISLTRPFKVGDEVSATIAYNQITGHVHGLGIVYVQIATEDGKVVYLPNSLSLTAPIVVKSI